MSWPDASGRQAQGRNDLQALKAAVPFHDLVQETHDLGRGGKVLCPAHADHTPSCHVYPDGFKCFSCGAHGDHIDWLEAAHALSTAEAIQELERRAGGNVPPVVPRPVTRRPAPTFKPVDEQVLGHHRRRAARLSHVPSSMAGRGFTLDDLEYLGFAGYGPDAVFPITGPDGLILALKRRFAAPPDGVRYRYATLGHGTPAWCSPGFSEGGTVLVVEGELNGMACRLAHPDLAVMGVAGTNGALHPQALQGREVYVYGDGDEPGQRACDRWAAHALGAGATKVYVLEPWPMDACDLAGRNGRVALENRLGRSLRAARIFGALGSFGAPTTAPNNSREGPHKPPLGHSGSRFSSGPRLGGKPCL